MTGAFLTTINLDSPVVMATHVNVICGIPTVDAKPDSLVDNTPSSTWFKAVEDHVTGDDAILPGV